MVNLVSHQVLSLHTPTYHYGTLTVYPYSYRRHIQFLIDLRFLYLLFLCEIPYPQPSHLHLQLTFKSHIVAICINSVCLLISYF